MIGLDLLPSACKRPPDPIADIFLQSAIQLASATAYMLALTVVLELATTQVSRQCTQGTYFSSCCFQLAMLLLLKFLQDELSSCHGSSLRYMYNHKLDLHLY